MHARLETLITLLDIEQLEANLFRAFHPPDRTKRLFGGQIMAQALVAAARTVPAERPVHSLHGYFLRAGDPTIPAAITVERIRDGRSFTTRRIVVLQRGQAIFNMDASFQVNEPGLSHQFDMPVLQPPQPDQIPPGLQDDAFVTWRHDHRRLASDEPQPPEQNVWFRANGELGDDPVLHAALLVYESDDALLSTARLPHRGNIDRAKMQVASLDHGMWFHQPARADQWLLYTIDAPSAAHARGFNRGSIFTASGELVCSTVQEGLMRVRD